MQGTLRGSILENLILATKAQQAQAALSSVQHRLASTSSILLLQNGLLGVYEELHSHVFARMQDRPEVCMGEPR